MNSSYWTALIWEQSFQITIVTVAVWLLARSVLKNRPHLTYLLWILVLLKCMTPPIGGARFSAWNLLTTKDRTTTSVTNLPPRIEDPPALPQPPSHQVVSENSEISTQATSQLTSLPTPQHILLMTWCGGVLVFVAVMIRAIHQVNRITRKHAVADDAKLTRLVSDVASDLGLRRPPTCVVLDYPLGPAVRGVIRPQLLFPRSLLEEVNDDQLRLIVLHELQHIRRGDVLAGYLQTLVQICWWFHPAVWIASRMCSDDRERCCDEGVLDHSNVNSSTYAQCLLDIARTSRRSEWSPTIVSISGVSAIRRRLEYIMLPIRRRTPTWIVCLAVLGLGLLILPGAQHAEETEPVTSVTEAKQDQSTEANAEVSVPKIIAITWQQRAVGRNEHTSAPKWTADGELLSEEKLVELRKDAPGTERHGSHPSNNEVPHPLIFIFDVGPIGRKTQNGVMVNCELPDGKLTKLGSWGMTTPGQIFPERVYTLSAVTDSKPRQGEFQWPKITNVHIRYPIEVPEVIQSFDTPVEKIDVAEGITWAIEPEAGFDIIERTDQIANSDGTLVASTSGKPYPAAVLESVIDESQKPLIDHWVRVYLKEPDRTLHHKMTQIRIRDGKKYSAEISERFPDFKNVKRIDVMRQRFANSVIKNVTIRTDLRPQTSE